MNAIMYYVYHINNNIGNIDDKVAIILAVRLFGKSRNKLFDVVL